MCSLDKRGNLFILTLTGGGEDHRLGPAVISSLLSALSAVKSQSTPGTALLTTSSSSKFFSNGFDLAWAQSSGGAADPSLFRHRLKSMVDDLKPVVSALITLPLPTVAALPGHAAAGGLLLALSHDYVVSRSDRGVLYMSEVDIGLPFPDYFAAVLRAKIADPSARRDVMLAGRRIRGDEAVAMGIAVAAHGGVQKVVEEAERLAEKLAARKWKGEVYAEIRMSMFPDLCRVLGIAAGPAGDNGGAVSATAKL